MWAAPYRIARMRYVSRMIEFVDIGIWRKQPRVFVWSSPPSCRARGRKRRKACPRSRSFRSLLVRAQGVVTADIGGWSGHRQRAGLLHATSPPGRAGRRLSRSSGGSHRRCCRTSRARADAMGLLELIVGEDGIGVERPARDDPRGHHVWNGERGFGTADLPVTRRSATGTHTWAAAEGLLRPRRCPARPSSRRDSAGREYFGGDGPNAFDDAATCLDATCSRSAKAGLASRHRRSMCMRHAFGTAAADHSAALGAGRALLAGTRAYTFRTPPCVADRIVT